MNQPAHERYRREMRGGKERRDAVLSTVIAVVERRNESFSGCQVPCAKTNERVWAREHDDDDADADDDVFRERNSLGVVGSLLVVSPRVLRIVSRVSFRCIAWPSSRIPRNKNKGNLPGTIRGLDCPPWEDDKKKCR